MDDARDQVERALLPDERLIWVGRPDPSVIFTAADGFLIPFGLFFTGFAVFWTFGVGSVIKQGLSPILLFGGLFIVIGLYYLVGRFFVKVATKRRTAYGVTDRRVVVVTARGVQECPFTGTQRTTKRARDGKHMTVTFGSSQPFSIFNNRGYYPNTGLDFFNFGGARPVAFFDVADVDGLTSALQQVDVARR